MLKLSEVSLHELGLIERELRLGLCREVLFILKSELALRAEIYYRFIDIFRGLKVALDR